MTKVLTSGVTPLAGFVQAAPAGSRGADATGAISSSAAAAMAAAGLVFCIRYVSPEEGSVTALTAQEAQGILGAKLGLMLAQRVGASGLSVSSALGTEHGQAAAASAKAAGLPMCTVLWLAVDNLPASTSATTLTSYYEAWYAAVYAAGYVPGLCVGPGAVLSASQLGALAFTHYWQAQGATAKPSPRGYQLVQGSASTVGGVSVRLDTAQNDAGSGSSGANQAEWLVTTPCS